VIAFSIHELARVGRYQISNDLKFTWRIDSRTGDVSACFLESDDLLPRCGPWGAKRYQMISDEELNRMLDRAKRAGAKSGN